MHSSFSCMERNNGRVCWYFDLPKLEHSYRLKKLVNRTITKQSLTTKHSISHKKITPANWITLINRSASVSFSPFIPFVLDEFVCDVCLNDWLDDRSKRPGAVNDELFTRSFCCLGSTWGVLWRRIIELQCLGKCSLGMVAEMIWWLDELCIGILMASLYENDEYDMNLTSWRKFQFHHRMIR